MPQELNTPVTSSITPGGRRSVLNMEAFKKNQENENKENILKKKPILFEDFSLRKPISQRYDAFQDADDKY